MKNIANNCGKIARSEKIFSYEKLFSLHVRYLSFISILLILLLAAFWGMVHTGQMVDEGQNHRDQTLSGLLYGSFTDAARSLRIASFSESDECVGELRRAGEAVERMIGGCTLYGNMQSSRLVPYLEQLAADCEGLCARADRGLMTDSDRALCLKLADQIDRLTEEEGALLQSDAGGRLDLRISPFLEAGWQLR